MKARRTTRPATTARAPRSPSTGRLAGACGLASVAWAVAVPLISGRQRTDYSPQPPADREAGESRPVDSQAVSLVTFLPAGVLATAFVQLAAHEFDDRNAAAGVWCFSGVGVGYLTAAFAPGDPADPTAGSLRHTMHNAAGVFEYLSGAAGLVLFGLATRHEPATKTLGRATLIAAVPYTVALAASASSDDKDTRRFLQRILEGTLFGWIMATSFHLLRRPSAVTR